MCMLQRRGKSCKKLLLFFIYENVKHLLHSTMTIPKMATMIINSMVVHKGFLKRQGGIIEFVNSCDIVRDI